MESLVSPASPMVTPSPAFWGGKKVLLTGHTGFKGSWLAMWLHHLGADVVGLALSPATTPNLYELTGIGNLLDSRVVDIRNAEQVAQHVRQINPDVVLHLAAQALVRASYRQPVDTFATNVLGTVHLLDALRHCTRTRTVVAVTTDKVYQNNEWHHPYRESDVLGGHDPYSASKAASELVVNSYRNSFFESNNVAISSARAGNVIGGGDWSAERLLPDAARAWGQGISLNIRRPESVRPWQHVLEPLMAYLVLAEQTWHTPALAGAYNFGPLSHEAATVREVMSLATPHWPGAQVHFADVVQGPHEAGLLTLDTAKARAVLGLAPCWPLAQAIERTVNWYHRHWQGEEAAALCRHDMQTFAAQAAREP
ncbi:MAG: CDP-glucose 4,6-dehydratase [Burkholderiales bacterium]|nr:CDP-glucose 4,6-dehydratase [Burkholderiales bacterium]